MEETKVCNKCKENLPRDTDHFHRRTNSKDGLNSVCKACRGYKYTSLLQVKKGYKECTECKIEKPSTSEFFNLGKSNKCKECISVYQEQYRKENDEHIKTAQEKYYQKNKKILRQHNRDYYWGNREEVLKYKSEYYEKNKESQKLKSREYRHNNREKLAEYDRKRYIENRVEALQYNRKYQRENPDVFRKAQHKYNARKERLPNTLTEKQWIGIKIDFNSRCAYCGMAEEEHLSMWGEQLHQEHLIPLSKGGGYTHNNIIPSCKTCNSSKHNRDFFEWYPNYKYYSKEREQKILKHLGYEDKKQQLALF